MFFTSENLLKIIDSSIFLVFKKLEDGPNIVNYGIFRYFNNEKIPATYEKSVVEFIQAEIQDLIGISMGQFFKRYVD
jgi:ABC-type transport system involved in Fe-S cluster assembly fused permease/ATPase subunit